MKPCVRRRIPATLSLLAVVTVLAVSPACERKPPAASWPEEEWPVATPESQGMDSVALSEAVRFIDRENINIHSILLIRNGYAVLNVSFYPYDGLRPHDVASVTKSVTATLLGQAAAEGILPGLDTPVRDIFGLPPPAASSEGWEGLTLEHLVTMASGLECGDPPVEETLHVLRRSPDWVGAALALPVVEEPGKRFDYCSPNFHILSAAIGRAAGTSLQAFAQDRLFGPLGIKRYVWPADPQGVSIGWGDLRLHPDDMARIGYLYLRHGRWRKDQVLPEGWVEKATTPRLAVPGGESDYGYGWWLAKGKFEGVYEARGRGGQTITVWPAEDILLVTTGGGYPRDPVVEALLPAVRPNRALPENPGAAKRLAEAVAAAARAPEPQPVPALPEAAGRISGRRFIMAENPLELDRFAISFADGASEARLAVDIFGRAFDFSVGMDGVYRFSETSPSGDPAALRGWWETPERFVLEYNEVTRVNRFRMEFTFSGDTVVLNYREPTGQISGRIRGNAVPGKMDLSHR